MSHETWYQIKMRAQAGGKHLSGAERMLPQPLLPQQAETLVHRAIFHPRGVPEQVVLKIEKIEPEKIEILDALPVSEIRAASVAEAWRALENLLREEGFLAPEKILAHFPETYPMRGAMVLDIETFQRWEPDFQRGIRVTGMDALDSCQKTAENGKNSFREAIVLATKTAHAPGIVGEICVSDDPGYVTGYFASRRRGYVRISPLKEVGDEQGGRLFLYHGSSEKVASCLDYLEHQLVQVRNIPNLPTPALPRPDRWERLQNTLETLHSAGLYRQVPEMESAPAGEVRFRGQPLVMLASNNYLNLAHHPDVEKLVQNVAAEWGTGSGGSRLTTGTSPWHTRLEASLAEWQKTESALLFNTGYMANVGVLSALCGPDDTIFSDALNHASIIDGCRLSKAKIVVYRHGDLDDLERKIRQENPSRGLVVSDGVFSMDGDLLPLPRWLKICEKYGLFSMVDDAHALGVLGETGRGSAEHWQSPQPDILVGTLSKTLGSEGGFVCGKETLIDFLRNRARSFIFSTALNALSVAAAWKSLEILQAEPWRVRKLQENVRFFCRELQNAGIPVQSQSAIVPILLGDERLAVSCSQQLLEKGIYLSAIRYPTVAHGKARLRVALNAAHTPETLRHSAAAIAQTLPVPLR
ncbi:MAG: 8-amino-7-oxononanoate synthase [Planctomycetia bacterium]|nr:8-amino-7-oxononanoate synthase [Planctomycetia bacterium]